jgi:pimeloyl-ACP methyl ester carboxylesterase
MSDVHEAAARLLSYNPRLEEQFAHHLALFGTREATQDRGIVWKFDPVHRTRTPQPFYLEQARSFWLRIQAPTLIVRGESSQLKWDETEERECVPDAKRTVIAGAGHMVHHEQPEALARALLEFLADVSI